MYISFLQLYENNGYNFGTSYLGRTLDHDYGYQSVNLDFFPSDDGVQQTCAEPKHFLYRLSKKSGQDPVFTLADLFYTLRNLISID